MEGLLMITSRRHYKSNRPCLRSFPWQRCWDGLGKPVFNSFGGQSFVLTHFWMVVDLSRQSSTDTTTAFFYILLVAAGMLNGENAWCWYIMYNNNNNNVTGCVDSSYPLPRRHLHLLLKKVTLKVFENLVPMTIVSTYQFIRARLLSLTV